MRRVVVVTNSGIPLETEATEPDFLSFNGYVCHPLPAIFVDTFVM
jgi:hypothetical protein